MLGNVCSSFLSMTDSCLYITGYFQESTFNSYLCKPLIFSWYQVGTQQYCLFGFLYHRQSGYVFVHAHIFRKRRLPIRTANTTWLTWKQCSCCSSLLRKSVSMWKSFGFEANDQWMITDSQKAKCKQCKCNHFAFLQKSRVRATASDVLTLIGLIRCA